MEDLEKLREELEAVEASLNAEREAKLEKIIQNRIVRMTQLQERENLKTPEQKVAELQFIINQQKDNLAKLKGE